MNLNKAKKIYFRFDAGGLIGFGHHGRVEAIAESCEDLNLSPVYVIRQRPSLRSFNFKYPVIWLKELPDVSNQNYESWISGSEQNEAEELLEKIPEGHFVFVDHYGLNSIFHNYLKSKSKFKTGSIYDFYKDSVSEDLVVNYNAGAEKLNEFYKQKSPHSILLLGVDYALVKKEIRQSRKQVKEPKIIQKVAVYLGGVNLQILKKAMALGIDSEFFLGKEIKWIINSETDLREMKKLYSSSNIEFLPRTENLISLYEWADVAMGACGVSFIERSVLGIPQLLFKVADNQKEIAEYLGSADLAYYAGDLEAEGDAQMLATLKQLDLSRLLRFTRESFKRIDGEGSQRVSRAISEEFFACG